MQCLHLERLASHALAVSSASPVWRRVAGGAPRCVATSARPQQSSTAEASLTWVAPENRQAVQRVLEQAERASWRWEPSFTEFLSPAVAADAMAALAGRSDVRVVPWGGFAQAERCRLLMGPEEVMALIEADPSAAGAVAALSVQGNFMFDKAAHPDFLGAILGTGVVRERVGDILVQGEAGAQVLVDPELVEHFEMSLTQVRTVPVKTQAIPLSQLQVAPPSTQEITSIESSLRLDAIASAGFRLSRAKVVALIESGDVRVNHKAVAKPSSVVKAGDLISMTGKGRLKVEKVDVTKKERLAVTMLRYS